MAELKDKLINYDGLEYAIDEVIKMFPKGFDGEVSITTTFNINTGLTEPLDTSELDNLKPGLYKLNFGNTKGIAYISENNQTIISNSLRVFCFRTSSTSKWNTYPLALINDTARSKTFTLSASKIYELINSIDIPDTSNLVTREEYDSNNKTINEQLTILSQNDSTLFSDYESLEDRVAELEKKGTTIYNVYGSVVMPANPDFTDTSEIDVLYDAGVYLVIVNNTKTNPTIRQTGILTITESHTTSIPYDVQHLELSNGRGYTRTASNKVWGTWSGWYEGRINDDKTSPSMTWSSYKLKNDYFTPINNSIDELNSKVDALELEAKIYTIYGIPTVENPTFVDTTEIDTLDKAGDYTVVVSGERSGVADLRQAGVLTVNVAPNAIITQMLHHVNHIRYTRLRIGGSWGAWTGYYDADIDDKGVRTNSTWSSTKLDGLFNDIENKIDSIDVEEKVYTIYGVPSEESPKFDDTSEINNLVEAGTYKVIVSGEKSGNPDKKQGCVLFVSVDKVSGTTSLTQILRYTNNIQYNRTGFLVGTTTYWNSWNGYLKPSLKDTTIVGNMTWSSQKINYELDQVRGDAANAQADVEELRNDFEESKLEAGKNIEIADKKINAKGYNFYSNNAFSEGELSVNAKDTATIAAIDKANLTITLSGEPSDIVVADGISTIDNPTLNDIVRVVSLDGTTLKVNKWLDSFVVGASLYEIGGGFAKGMFSHAEGVSFAEGSWSHSEGLYNVAEGNYSHVEGAHNIVKSRYSHVEGYKNSINTTNSYYSHVEGRNNVLNSTAAQNHIEGRDNIVGGDAQTCHIEGASNICNSGLMVHMEGNYNEFIGTSTMDGHIEGFRNKGWNGQHIEGWYNIPNTESASYNAEYPKYSHIIGNGTTDSNRSNAYMLDYLGNAWYQTDVKCGGGSPDTPEHKLSLKADKTYVDEKIAEAGGGTTYKAGRLISIENDVIGSESSLLEYKTGVMLSVMSGGSYSTISRVDKDKLTIYLDTPMAYNAFNGKLRCSDSKYGKVVNIVSVTMGPSNTAIVVVDEWLDGFVTGGNFLYDSKNNFSSGNNPIMLGQNGKVTANSGFTFGNGNEVGIARGIALGYFTEAKTNTDELVCGWYNDSVPNQVFAVGNGTSTSNRSNALSLSKEGTLWAKEVISGGSFTSPEHTLSLKANKSDVDEQLNTLGERVSALEQGGGQTGDYVTREEFELLENQVSSIEDSVSELDSKISEVDNKIDDRVDNLGNRVDELEERISALENTDNDFVSKEEFDSTIEGMRTEFESLINDSIQQCDNKYETLYEEVNKINERIDNLEPGGGDFATKEELTQLSQDMTSGFEELGNRLQAEESKSESFSAAFDSVNEAINEINQKIDNLQPGGGSEVTRQEFNELKDTVDQTLNTANTANEVANSAVQKAEASAETADKALTQLNDLTLWKGTEEEYNSTDKDDNTIYFII